MGKMSKEYDNQLKGYIHILNAGGLSKMQIPPNDKISLGLMQGTLVFQMFLASPKSFTIEVAITDTQGVKRRLLFSSCSKELVINQYHCRIPLINFPLNIWVNLSIDILSFVSECFKAQSFRAIDYICLSANCKVRRICAMRSNYVEMVEMGDESLLPKGMVLPKGIEFVNLNLDMDIVKNMEIVNGKKNSIPVSSQGMRGNANLNLAKLASFNVGNNNNVINSNSSVNKKRSKSVNKFAGNHTMKTKNEIATNNIVDNNIKDNVAKTQKIKGEDLTKQKKNSQWGMYDQNGRRITKNVTANQKSATKIKQQIKSNEKPKLQKYQSANGNRMINTQKIPKDIMKDKIELHSPNQNLLNTFNYKNIENELSKAINENASIAEVVDFDCTNINNTILTKHDNNNEVYHDNNDNLNLLDNFIKDTKIEPNVNILNEIETKNEILNDIFVNEGLDPNFSIMETNRPYTPPLSKMVPLQDENNNNINVNNISKINESIIHNHYPEMVYDTKRGKYYNSKTNVYYDFK